MITIFVEGSSDKDFLELYIKYLKNNGDIKNESNLISRERIYYIENPNEKTFEFLNDVLEKDKKKVRGYSEYILYSLFNHYFDYIKN